MLPIKIGMRCYNANGVLKRTPTNCSRSSRLTEILACVSAEFSPECWIEVISSCITKILCTGEAPHADKGRDRRRALGHMVEGPQRDLFWKDELE